MELNEVYVLYCRWMNDSRRSVVAMYDEWAAEEEELELKLSYEELKNHFLKIHTTDTWTQFKKRWNRLPEENRNRLLFNYQIGHDLSRMFEGPYIYSPSGKIYSPSGKKISLIETIQKHCGGENSDISEDN